MEPQKSKTFLKQLVRFGMVGVANTILSTVLMLVLYDIFQMGYWGSSVIAYIAGALFSFAANRRFTFQSQNDPLRSFLRFILVVAVCYLCAYGSARLIVAYFLKWMGWTLPPGIRDKITMLGGMGLYTVLNFIGQKFLVFRDKASKE